MIYNWFKIFNLDDFLATGLTSRTYTYVMAGIGLQEILVTHGETIGMLYKDVFLSINMSSKNPFEFEGYAVFLSPGNNVYLGIAVADAN